MKKKILIGLGIVILLLIGAVIGLEAYLNKKLDDALRHDLDYQLGYAYDIDFVQASVSLFKNEVNIKNLSFARHGGEDYDWIFTAARVEFSGFRGVDFLLGKGFGVDTIVLLEPAIDMKRFVFSDNKSDSTQSKSTREPKPGKENADSLKISIGGIVCRGGILNYDPEGPEYLNCNFDFGLRGIEFEGKIKNVEKLWDESSIVITDANYQFADSVYVIKVDEINLSDFEEDVLISNFSLASNFSKADYPKHFGWRKSRLQIDIPELSFSSPKNFNDSLLVISHVNIDSIYFEIHKDARFPFPDRVTKLPQGPVANLPFPVRVDSINFKNSEFKFIGVFEDNNKLEIYFNDIEGALTGFQNIDTTGSMFAFHADAKFMGESSFAMNTTYNYGNLDPFKLQASLGKSKLFFISDFLQGAAGIRISDGEISELKLNMTGNTYGEYGYVDVHYNNLQIEAVDKDTGEKKWLLNVVTDIARGLLFWKENPDSKKFRRGDFSKERTLYKAFASQWIEGLFDGLVHSVSKIDPSKVTPKKDKKKKEK